MDSDRENLIGTPVPANAENALSPARTNRDTIGSPHPSAPSAPSEIPLHGLDDPDKCDGFIRRVYLAIGLQHAVLASSFAIFVYIPHMRKIIRRHLFDPIWLGSCLGFPLIILIAVMCLFRSWRRRIGYGLSVVAAICISLLLSYAIPMSYASAMISHLVTDLISDGGMFSLTFGARRYLRLRPTSWPSLALLPFTAGISTGFITSFIVHSQSSQVRIFSGIIGPLTGTFLSTYVGTNLRSMIAARSPSTGILLFQPGDHLYAASVVYYWPAARLFKKPA